MKQTEIVDELIQVWKKKSIWGLLERISQMMEEESDPSNLELLAGMKKNFEKREREWKETLDQMKGMEVR